MADITIPPAALEAGKLVLLRGIYGDDQMPCAELASAAFRAMLEAWEGAKTVRDDGRRQTYAIPALILPLPQEDGDELA